MTDKKGKQTENSVVEESDLKDAKVLVEDLFSLIGIDDQFEISTDSENNAVLVDIKETEKAGLIIGRKGETIQSLQMILGLIYKNKTDKWIRFLINVADWREKQDARLSSLAEQASERARQTGQPQHLYNLSSAERRIIHMQLVNDDDIETESLGEGRERYLVVRVKN